MTSQFHSLVGLGLIVMVAVNGGCDSGSKYPPVTVGPSPSVTGPKVPTPQFVHWAQFPLGTHVTRKKTVTNPDGSITVMTTQRLIEKTDEQIKVQQQKTVDRPDGRTEHPAQDFVFVASFRLPPNLKEEQFALPSLKAKLTGREEIEVAAQTYDAEVFEWEEVNESGPMAVKIWRSNAVPGQTLREEMLIQSTGQVSNEEIVEYAIPQPDSSVP